MPFPLDEKYVREAETKLGVKFPPDFVAYMLTDNGGTVFVAEDYWELHPFLDTSDQRRLRRTCNDIARETLHDREMEHFPRTAVSIADNGTGDKLVFLRVEGSDALHAGIYLWGFHGEGLSLVADCFESIRPIRPKRGNAIE